MEEALVQGALRPVELWDYVFPEECLNDVLSMLEINPETQNMEGWGMDRIKKQLLKRYLGGLEDIPKYDKVVPPRFIEKRGIALYPLGIKKDLRGKGWGYEQEML